ncbi:MAG: sigma-70 family RNA polymerase sigma factor [Myxococcales bacterium]|nr:sigma-70 family RNA polymerase sigma factor [Myxococcales bacterium]MDD9970036.1 sigma-70 family RNA polymerase sigma factor [Myxococcales bacterium]
MMTPSSFTRDTPGPTVDPPSKPSQAARRPVESEVDADIRVACDAGNYGDAVTALLRCYGDDLMSFLVFRLGDRSAADEAFALLAEDLWASLPRFEFRSRVKTWAYTVATHVASRYARAPHRRRERNLSLSQHGQLSQLVAHVRSRTHRYLQTEVKSRMGELREQLAPEDQLLLVLRVNRQLSFRDAAMVMLGDPHGVPDAELEREAARLRKRFERVKAELRRMAEQEGLL